MATKESNYTEMNNPNQPVNSSQTTIESQSISNPANYQKGFFPVILGVLVLLLAVGGGVYYLGTQKNQTTGQTTAPTNPISTPSVSNESTNDWKTLTNARFGYLFKYPSNKYNETIYTTEPFLYTVQYCPTKKLEDCAFPSNIFQVNAYDNPQNTDIENWLKTSSSSPVYKQGKINCNFNDPRTIKSTKDFLGQTAITYEFAIDQDTATGVCKGVPLEGGGKYKYIFAERKNRIYWISISLASKEVYSELEQILQTFSFTDSTLKTYTNSEYRFTFQYPSTYIEQQLTEKWSSGKLITGFSDNVNEELYVYIENKPVKEYLYENNEAQASYRFDTSKKEWISTFTGEDPSGGLKRLAPKRVNTTSEIYFVKHSEGGCGGGTAFIFPPSYSYVVTAAFTCIHAYEENDILRNQANEKLDQTYNQILSTFKFTN